MSSQVPKPAIMKLSSAATLTMIQSVSNDSFQVCCQQLTAGTQLGPQLGHSSQLATGGSKLGLCISKILILPFVAQMHIISHDATDLKFTKKM